MAIIVTIGVCVRNSERFIKHTINSLVNQDFPKDKMEIIFVDDGSTDRTLKIIMDFASKTQIQTRVFSQKHKGIASARNLVVTHARGRYIVWVDGDMVLSPDFLKKQVKYMELNPKLGVAKGRYGFLKSKKLAALLENCRSCSLIDSNSKLAGTGGAIYRVKAIKEIGGFDENIKGAGEDIDAVLQILKKGWLFSFTDAIFYERFKETWKGLWKQYYWWGYGAHYILHKHKKGISLFTRLPPIAFMTSLLRLIHMIKTQKKAKYLLLPLHNIFKETAWCLGFFMSHIDGYGHKQ